MYYNAQEHCSAPLTHGKFKTSQPLCLYPTLIILFTEGGFQSGAEAPQSKSCCRR